MLPEIAELEYEDLLTEQGEKAQIGKSFLFDFEKGDFVSKDGKVQEVDEKEALKMWIESTIRTEKDKYKVYEGTGFGPSIEDLIGTTYNALFAESELQRELTEALTVHPVINSLTNWSFESDGSKLTTSFTVVTDSDEFEVKYDGT